MKTNKLTVMKKLYDFFLHETESFEEEHIGADLAYLFGAILKNDRCEWEDHRPIVGILREHKNKPFVAYALKHVKIVRY